MSDTIAGRYTLIDPIARGGSGTVWRAWDQRRAHLCAAKVLRQRDSSDLLRFVREQSIKIDHPHVLAPYGWAAEDEHVVIAMELCDGGTLEDVLQDHGALSDEVTEEILRQLISALRFVHAEGWIHRDVKPANLMLQATGTARPRTRLADFGIAAQAQEARLTRVGTVVGTRGYLAPELLDGADPDPAQDLYAAGAVALRMVRPDAPRGTSPTPEDALEAFGADSLLGAEVAALLDPDPQVREDGALSLAERLEGHDDVEITGATTRDGEPLEIFPRLAPLPEAWQAVADGRAAASHEDSQRLTRPWTAEGRPPFTGSAGPAGSSVPGAAAAPASFAGPTAPAGSTAQTAPTTQTAQSAQTAQTAQSAWTGQTAQTAPTVPSAPMAAAPGSAPVAHGSSSSGGAPAMAGRRGPLSAIGVHGAAAWAVLVAAGLLLLGSVAVVFLLLQGTGLGGGAEPTGVETATEQPTPEATSAPTVTAEPREGTEGPGRILRQGTGGSGLGGS